MILNRARLEANLKSVQDRVGEAARRAGRDPDSVRLVAVTKRCPADWARSMVELGILDLGENYPQELWNKAEELADVPVRWHLIGHLQSNKARRTLPLVRMVHGVDSLQLLTYLDELAAGWSDPPAVCLQVNTSNEVSKHGWEPEELLADADGMASFRHVRIAGLMTMAALGTDAETARPAFAHLREIRDRLRVRTGLLLPALSMGMSADFETAIEEGATLVRVGSALFEGIDP